MSVTQELHGFLWIEKIKQHAKDLKESLPDLGYLERLEIAARQFAGKRDYQECHSLHEKHLLFYRYVEGQSIEQQIHDWHCTFCGLRFDPTFKAGKQEHQERHRLFEAAYYTTGYIPDCYAVREAKIIGIRDKYNNLSPSDSKATRLELCINIYKRFYDRSFEQAILGRYWNQHPPFQEYVAMTEIKNVLHPDDFEMLHKKFGSLKGHIPPGHSYWTPKGSNIPY
ncbi:hypothetical protein ACWJJH_20095 [Endozoicomonadaceae bacterium StTr2]